LAQLHISWIDSNRSTDSMPVAEACSQGK
jgi:hypothetical protein